MYATHLDLYQLTSLIPHWKQGLGTMPVCMSFFSRRLPQNLQKETARGLILFAGLRRCLSWLQQAHFDDKRLDTLLSHPMLGRALKAEPELLQALKEWRFKGKIWAIREGEVIWAQPAQREDGTVINLQGVRPASQTPYLQIHCDLLTAKLIETPLLSIINHMTMVASKAAHIVIAAGTRPVFEFGSRRTHIEAAVDAAYAAYLAGVQSTSNVEALHRYGVPAVGTMDHFAIQSWETPQQSIAESEAAFFRAFYQSYPQQASLLVDTYDTFGETTGIRNAFKATQGNLKSIRIDSQISSENMKRARQLLDELGAHDTQIIVSGGMDEQSILALADSPVDAFGVGERLVTSADAPVGVGAVGKLSQVNGRYTMKQAKGSAKATLPGPIQVYRSDMGDRLTLLSNQSHSDQERALIHQVWDEDGIKELPTLTESRDYAAHNLKIYVQHTPVFGRSVASCIKSQRVYVDQDLYQVIHDIVTAD
jgi:nicotinate phosphoribosyltransferase